MTEEQLKHKAVVDMAMSIKFRDERGRVMICPHPATKRVYKTDKVNIFVCQMCKYVVHYKWSGAISCGYKSENIQEEGTIDKQ